MGDIAKDLALVQVEPKGDLRVLEVVVTPASIGLVGAGEDCGEQKEKKPCRKTLVCSGRCAVLRVPPDIHVMALLWIEWPACSRALIAFSASLSLTSR